MRAEEMNVVDAAIAYYQDDSAADNHNALMDAVQNLIFACPQCNTGTHTCPGCGTGIGHFEGACGRCMDDSASVDAQEPEGTVEHRIMNTRERLLELSVIRSARDYVHDNPAGLAELMQDKALRAAVEELTLWHGSDTHLLADLDQERDEISRTDREEALNPDHRCSGCGEPIGHSEALCGRCEDGRLIDSLYPMPQEPQELEPEYVPAEWQHVLAGDRVRLGTQEAEVTRSSVGTWHADNSDRYRPRPWKHAEVSISLAHLDRSLIMAPGGPVEILADRERAAVLMLQKAFPEVA